METHGHISGYRASSCANDLDTTEWAKQLADGHDIGLWSGERVVRLGRQKPNDL